MLASRSLVTPLLAALLAIVGCERPSTPSASDADNGVTLLEGMGGDPDPGFERAIAVRPFVFPRDHGAHPGFATEWWYFTGNLFTDAGRRFGYQLTLFRVGLTPGEPAADEGWRTHQMYMGHLALSDIAAAEHRHAERFSRAAAGLAGAIADPLQVWLGPWSIRGTPGGAFPLTIDAATETFALQLTLGRGDKPVVLQGDRGLSQKSAAPGNASYYYSHTRLPTQGLVVIDDKRFRVSGNSWWDREWSSSALADDQAGWDWFALQLDDGRDLMFYRMRDRQGQAQRFSRGVLVEVDGTARELALADVSASPTRYWTNQNGARYPVAWQLQVPAHGLDLNVETVFDDQSMDTTVAYWEGAVDVSGSHSGIGYLELSGYADRDDQRPESD